MYSHMLRSTAEYRCRSTGTYVGCGLGVREDALLPWGRSLVEWLESRPHPDLEPELYRSSSASLSIRRLCARTGHQIDARRQS